MRKYQQLALLIISTFSVIILLLYKNENSRLKDVLHVVNIFGRSDEAVLHRLENFTKDESIPQLTPLPVWHALSDSYHSYAAFWNRNELMAGGEVLALVVGKHGAVVNFGCSLLYDGGLRSVRGKFHFQRVDDNNEDRDSEFTSYNFFCRVVRDFGNPEFVVFNDITNGKHIAPELRIRHIKPLQKNTQQSNTLNLCVDLVTPNRTSNFTKNESNLLQFFLHHQGLGVLDFIVYNGDEIPYHVLKLLNRFNMRLHMMPFNFPFSIVNATERVRRIIETDCLVRNTNNAAHALLLQPNEFFYPKVRLESPNSVLRSIRQHTGNVNRFELPQFAVCVDRKHKLLVDSTLYDPEMKPRHRIFIYRAHIPATVSQAKTDTSMQSASLSLSTAFTHRYVDCLQVGKDGLHDWRNSLRDDFMNHIQDIRTELDMII